MFKSAFTNANYKRKRFPIFITTKCNIYCRNRRTYIRSGEICCVTDLPGEKTFVFFRCCLFCGFIRIETGFEGG